jgi:dTDP-D-glucose 4,6-dehydratase
MTMCAYSEFACCSQVVVVDKLDYCATLNNLTFAKDNPNFKVSADRMHPLSSCCDGLTNIQNLCFVCCSLSRETFKVVTY